MPIFNDEAVKRISRVVRIVESASKGIALPEPTWVGGSQSAWFRTPVGGITAFSGSTLGSATCDRRKLDTTTGQLGYFQLGGVTQTATVWNPHAWTIPGSQDVQAELVDGNWVLTRPYHYKLVILFKLAATLTTSDASKTGTIDAQYGPGIANTNTGSGAITVYNMKASSNYVFSGASNDYGMAVWHDANNYYIIQMEC